MNASGNDRKVIFLGNSGVGKTSILQYKLNNKPSDQLPPTIGCINHEITVQTHNGKTNLKVWDTAGQEVYRSIVPIYVRGASAAILVFDLTDIKSFESLDSWRSLLIEEEPEQIPIFVVGNKVDIDNQVVNDQMVNSFASKIGAKYIKTSGKTGINVNNLFRDVVEAIDQNKMFTVNRSGPKEKRSKGCC